ncbi:MAG: hypothetical protein ACRCX2_34240 [Paraclostridium sp.]
MVDNLNIYDTHELREFIIKRLSRNDVTTIVKIMLAHPSLDIADIMGDIGDPGYKKYIFSVYLELSRVLRNMIRRNSNNMLVMYSVLSKFRLNILLDAVDKDMENPLIDKDSTNLDCVKFGEYTVLIDLLDEFLEDNRLMYSSLLDFLCTEEHNISLSTVINVLKTRPKHLSNEILFNLFSSQKMNLVTTIIMLDTMDTQTHDFNLYIDNLIEGKNHYLTKTIIELYEYVRDGHSSLLYTYVKNPEVVLKLRDRLLYHVNKLIKDTILSFVDSSLRRPEIPYETVEELEVLRDTVDSYSTLDITNQIIATKYLEPHDNYDIIENFLTFELSIFQYVQRVMFSEPEDLFLSIMVVSSLYTFNCKLVSQNKVSELCFIFDTYRVCGFTSNKIIDGRIYEAIVSFGE